MKICDKIKEIKKSGNHEGLIKESKGSFYFLAKSVGGQKTIFRVTQNNKFAILTKEAKGEFTVNSRPAKQDIATLGAKLSELERQDFVAIGGSSEEISEEEFQQITEQDLDLDGLDLEEWIEVEPSSLSPEARNPGARAAAAKDSQSQSDSDFEELDEDEIAAAKAAAAGNSPGTASASRASTSSTQTQQQA